MQLPRTTIQTPTGLSFDIPDLLLVRAWADFHNLRMEIELDIAAGGDEYEELLNLSSRGSERRRWMIWRSRDGIVVQPMMGRKMMFDVMADALEVLIPVED
nr:hypothetical protein [uncultured Rhodopila sp.]